MMEEDLRFPSRRDTNNLESEFGGSKFELGTVDDLERRESNRSKVPKLDKLHKVKSKQGGVSPSMKDLTN